MSLRTNLETPVEEHINDSEFEIPNLYSATVKNHLSGTLSSAEPFPALTEGNGKIECKRDRLAVNYHLETHSLTQIPFQRELREMGK